MEDHRLATLHYMERDHAGYDLGVAISGHDYEPFQGCYVQRDFFEHVETNRSA